MPYTVSRIFFPKFVSEIPQSFNMPVLIFDLFINALVSSARLPVNTSLLVLASVLAAILSSRSINKQELTFSQNKELKKLKRKMRWALLKNYFRKRVKLSVANILTFLVLAAIAVLIVVWLGWIIGLLLIIGSVLLTRVIDKAQKRRDGG